MHPEPQEYDYDLDRALTALVGLRADVPADAFTAETLGTERAGYGVMIRGDGLVLTVGYLIMEAETIWLTMADKRAVQGHVLAYDHETGFGLVQALARLDAPWLPLGDSRTAKVGDEVVIAGAGGRQHAVAAQIVARREFVGYWEYLLEDAFFTMPAHPNWGGTAMIGPTGRLLGIGSLLVQGTTEAGQTEDINMVIPIDLLKPILDDLLTRGRPDHPPRPWLGLYAAEIDNRVVVANMSSKGPAARSPLRSGDIVVAVSGENVGSLAEFYRHVWALGEAGIEVPLTVNRDGERLNIKIASGDRRSFLKGPRAH